MLSSIHPFGERARQQSYKLTVVAYISGSVSGGLVLGSALALLAIPIPSTNLTTGLALAVLVSGGIWEAIGWTVPSLERQVDETWLSRYRGWVYGLGYGFQLGVGFITYVKSPLTYAFALAAILAGSPMVALVAGAMFGVTRGLSILATLRVDSPADLRSFFDRLARSGGLVRQVGAVSVAFFSLLGLVVVA